MRTDLRVSNPGNQYPTHPGRHSNGFATSCHLECFLKGVFDEDVKKLSYGDAIVMAGREFSIDFSE